MPYNDAMRLTACALLAAIAGCSPFGGGGAFTCETDAECAGGPGPGRCEQVNGFCSFADGACASGQRYGTSSGSLSNVCVGDEPAIVDASSDAMGGEPALPDAPVDAPLSATTTNHPCVADTFLASDGPNSNYNVQTSALVDGDTQRVVLMRFDLSALPPGTSIVSAELHVWTDFDPGQTCTFYPVLESWDETTTTWNVRTTGTAWMTAGAAPPSRSTTAAATVLPAAAETEYTVALPPAVVTGWVTSPTTNNGLVITTTDADGTRFSTREHAMAARHPYLRVTHVP